MEIPLRKRWRVESKRVVPGCLKGVVGERTGVVRGILLLVEGLVVVSFSLYLDGQVVSVGEALSITMRGEWVSSIGVGTSEAEIVVEQDAEWQEYFDGDEVTESVRWSLVGVRGTLDVEADRWWRSLNVVRRGVMLRSASRRLTTTSY